jgi:hypothetical protein
MNLGQDVVFANLLVWTAYTANANYQSKLALRGKKFFEGREKEKEDIIVIKKRKKKEQNSI